MFLGPMLFAAGAAAIGGDGGGDALSATLDGGAREGAGEGAGDGAGTGEGDGPGAGDGTGEGAGEDTGEGAGEGAAAKDGAKAGVQDGRKMAAAVRQHLAELKTSNPALFKELNTIYWGFKNQQSEITKNFPGGLKEAVELKGFVEEIGGREGVEELQGEMHDYRALDKQWIDGDPEFVNAAVGQYPDGFKKLMPHMMTKFASVDPDGYDRYVSGAIFNTLRDSEFTTNLRLAAEYLSGATDPQVKRALSLLTGNYQWIQDLKKIATTQPAAAANDPREKQLSAREQSIQSREKQTLMTGVRADLWAGIEPGITKTFTELAKGKSIADGGKQQVTADAMGLAYGILSKDKRFSDKYDAFINAGDRMNAVKLLRSRMEPLMAEATTKAFRRLYGEASLGSKKTGDGQGQGQGQGQGRGQSASTAPGFQLISFDPKPTSIDRAKTTREMIFKNQAVLKDGRKVTWKAGAPSEK
jgi:hypothetical protein